MKHGDFIFTQNILIADNGEKIPANTVGAIVDDGGIMRISCKFKGEQVVISEFRYSDIQEAW